MSALILFIAYLCVALYVAGRPGTSDSRRALAVALATMLPGVGLPLAIMVRRLRGSGTGSDPKHQDHALREVRPDEVLTLADQPCALDRLMSRLPEERLDALVALASAADANSISLLRWTVQYGPREPMLEAALTLEELDLQRARTLDEASRAFDDHPSVATALAAGDAALAGILNGLADRDILADLAERARACFHYALAADPTVESDIAWRLFVLDEDPRCAAVGHAARG